ncbi:hypothetical protein EM6_2839 [Asticcacaulis excentricus]|uniref:Uncharacterized protein n=1 Tax=Asticcacaulis excentricus TaxID=78587 RepID=A0A3G9G5Y0_9CAUL|nr:hypothetical protein EM6_2839 [Asticcacaulis excentricus]
MIAAHGIDCDDNCALRGDAYASHRRFGRRNRIRGRQGTL